MSSISIEIFGLCAGAITSMGFIPQLIKGYRTKKLNDISYLMPSVLAFGMTLWTIYGMLLASLAIIIANLFGVSCCVLLLAMKKVYSQI